MAAIGWVGLGRIGLPMARRLKQAGHDVSGWDIAPQRRDAAREQGVPVASAAGEFLPKVDGVFLSVTDGNAVEQAVFGEGGIAAAARPGTLIVDHSTIAPDRTVELARRARSLAGLRWVDAPISGGVEAADRGELVAWLGGSAEDVAPVHPLIGCYASKIRHLGPLGRGQMTKSCNQMIVAGTVALWSQMLRYAKAADFDLAQLVEALDGGAADSFISHLLARTLAESALPQQSAYNWTKDLKIAVAQARALRVDTPMADAALTEFETVISARA
jgi:3-hydroxyisobutyrate dehydrogenase